MSDIEVVEVIEDSGETEVVEIGLVTPDGLTRQDLEDLRQEVHDADQELAGLIADTRTEVIRVEHDLGERLDDVAEEHRDDLEAHVDSDLPHPAYDDMPSLLLIYENGLTS